MADGHTKTIDQVKVGDKVKDAVPGESEDRVHTVQTVIVTTTDHDFVDVTVAPTKQPSRIARAAVATMAAAAVTAATPTAEHGGTLTTTFHHPFYDRTQAAFVDAKDLRVGDELQTSDGGTATVTALRLYHASEVTYDLTIDGLHTYYVLAGALSVLVHNCNEDLFDTFGVKPGENLDLSTPSGANGRSFITYAAEDAEGNVRYVGRASGKGSPTDVLRGRLARGHHIFKENPEFTPRVIDVQGSLNASKGAEEFFMQGYLQRGAKLLNSADSPPLGFSRAERGAKSVRMMDSFFEDLFARG